MPQADAHASEVVDLITGRWRSQILYVGTALGVFDALEGAEPHPIETIARTLDAAPETLYRLLRALAAIGLLVESPRRCFALTPRGAYLRKDHPASLRAMSLLEEGPVHYGVWKHLTEIVRSGLPDGFKREYGQAYFSYLQRDPAYARVFSDAMSSYSAGEAPAVRKALRDCDFRGQVLCDIGGSAGALLAEILRDHAAGRAIVFDLPEVVAEVGRPEASIGDGGTALNFVGGDMFEQIPSADVYLLKHILHDWPDDDCLRILSGARRASAPGGRLIVCEMLVPAPDTPHFSKLIDIHMMVVQSGRQRTADEIGWLLHRSAWTVKDVRALDGCPLSVVQAEAAKPSGG